MKPTLEESTVEVQESAEDLAYMYCERSRRRKKVDMEEYLRRCPDEKARETFTELVNADLLLSLAMSLSKRR